MGDSTYPVSSVVTTVRIVEALNELGEAGITEVAANTSLSNSTVHKHLNTLRSLGYVRKNGTTYALSLRFLGIGTRARSRYEIVRVAKPFVDDLRAATGATTNVVILEHGCGVYAYRSPTSVEMEAALPAVGESVSLHTTAAGKAILSELEWTEVREIIDDGGRLEVTEQPITSSPARERELQSIHHYSESRRGRTIFQLRQRLRSIQRRGFALQRAEHGLPVQCIAASITTDRGPMAAISVSSDIEQMDESELEDEMADLVTSTANDIEAELVQSCY